MNDAPKELLCFPSTNHSSDQAERAAAITALINARLPVLALKPRSKEPRYPNWQNDPRGPLLAGDNVGIRHDDTADVDIDQPEFAPIFAAVLPRTSARWGRRSAPDTHFLYRTQGGRKVKHRGANGDRPIAEIHSGSGHQSMAPGSVHPCGESVRWEPGCGLEPAEVEFALLERQVAIASSCSLLASRLQPGNFHDLSIATIGVLLRAGVDRECVSRALKAMRSIAGCDNGSTCEIVRDIPKLADRLAHGGDGVPGIPKLAELIGPDEALLIAGWLNIHERAALIGYNDNANAERIYAEYGDKMRWDVGRRVWLTCDAHGFFVEDKRGIEGITRGQAALRGWIHDAATEADANKRRKMLEHGNQSLNLPATMRALELLKTKPGISILSEEFNANPWLLGTQNGVLELRLPHGPKLRPATASDLITQRAGTTWQPEGRPTAFLAALNATFEGDDELIGYVQRVCGSMLVGVVTDQTLFFWHGLGANGKSLLKNVVLRVLGDYGGTLSATAIEASGDDLAMLELAGLQHKRAVFTVETRQNKRINSVLLKLISGEDAIHVRVLYVGVREYRPHFKLVILGNFKPSIDPDDEAMWRRLQMTPFNHQFLGSDCDPGLLAKLEEELPGILRWMVDGCVEWQRIGLCPPPGVLHATREYRAEQDLFDQWLCDVCEVGDGFTATFQELHRSYEDYAHGVRGKSYTTTAFGRRLVGAGLQKLTRKDIPTTYSGARVRAIHRKEKF